MIIVLDAFVVCWGPLLYSNYRWSRHWRKCCNDFNY
jgi:hypothetical protein